MGQAHFVLFLETKPKLLIETTMQNYLMKLLLMAVIFTTSINISLAQTIRLTTEEYPPFNMSTVSGRIIGFSTDVVKELFSRAGIDYSIEILPWKRAYNLALDENLTGVFSTTRTEARENLFKWVTPVVENNWVFLAKASSNIQLNSLDDAKGYKIGAYRGSANTLYLLSQGFKIDMVSRDELNANKIDRERIDLWATGQSLGPYYAKKHGVTGLVEVFSYKQTILGIAFNKQVPDEIVDKLNSSLREMETDGSMAQIKSLYQ